jgi:hypothetical protein
LFKQIVIPQQSGQAVRRFFDSERVKAYFDRAKPVQWELVIRVEVTDQPPIRARSPASRSTPRTHDAGPTCEESRHAHARNDVQGTLIPTQDH